MLVVGAKGHAKEILGVMSESLFDTNSVFFFDDVSDDNCEMLFDDFKILRSLVDVEELFRQNADYVFGIGSGIFRSQLKSKFDEIGGSISSIISISASIGKYDVVLGQGLNIMKEVFISNSVKIGDGTLINFRSSIHHDCVVGDFCDLSPNCQLLGGAKIGDYTSIGAGAIVLPKVNIGSNCIIGAGALVNEDVPDGLTVVGVPAKSVINRINVQN